MENCDCGEMFPFYVFMKILRDICEILCFLEIYIFSCIHLSHFTILKVFFYTTEAGPTNTLAMQKMATVEDYKSRTRKKSAQRSFMTL